MERIELRDSSIDDEGLAIVASLPKMNFIDLTECRLDFERRNEADWQDDES